LSAQNDKLIQEELVKPAPKLAKNKTPSPERKQKKRGPRPDWKN